MRNRSKAILVMVTVLLLPLMASGQGLSSEIKGLQSVLEELYNEMIGMSSDLISVGRGIAGFAATWYIAYRVWGHISRAEPVDVYPLLRPFAIGLAITFFPGVIGIVNGVMKPTVTGTASMVKGSNVAIEKLLKQKEEALKDTPFWKMYVGENGEGDRNQWYRYTHGGEDPSEEGTFASIGNDVKFAMSKAFYNFSNNVKEWMAQVLEVVFQAAALCINTLRTFQLIVLAILGPLVLGISVFDGFHHSLTMWLARYVNVFLWLPVANIFGAIIGRVQQKMIELDIGQIAQTGDTFFSAKDTAYLVFLIIGIVGYFTVPSIAGFIVNIGGGGALSQKVTNLTRNTAGDIYRRSAKTVGSVFNARSDFNAGYSGTRSGQGPSGSIGRSIGYGNAYLAGKISGSKKDD